VGKPSHADSLPTPISKSDSAGRDTVVSRKIQIPKLGEANPAQLPAFTPVSGDTLEVMPPQGPQDKPISQPLPADTLATALVEDTLGEQASTLTAFPPKLQRYTASSMLLWGQWEAKYFQQIYSQTHYFDGNGKPQPQNARSTYYSGIASFTLGLKTWLNFGMEAWLRSVRIDQPSASPFAILGFQSGPNSRTALGAIGPKVKIQPLRAVNGFSIQSALLIPVGRDLEGVQSGRPFLATQNLQWWTQFYFTQQLSNHWQLFAEVDAYASLLTRASAPGQVSTFALPVSVYLSYFPSNRVTVYVMNQVWPTTSSVWYQAGIGGKLRFTEQLEVEMMYGRFLAGIATAGQANAFNLGVRFVKW
jgi:hypothetical protein